MDEANLQAGVLGLAGLYRWLRYHTADSRKSHQGFPDLVLLKPPRLIFAELKGDTEYGRRGPTHEQQLWLDGLAQIAVVETYLWTPSDWSEIQKILSPHWRPAPQQGGQPCPQ